MKALRGILTSALFLTLVLPLTAQSTPAAILEYYEDARSVKIVDSDGFEISEIYFGMELSPGDRLQTTMTNAEIRLSPNGTIVKIGKNTEFRVDALQGRKGSDTNSLALFAGKLRMVAARTAGSKYEIRTPAAVCGVRGTDFGMEVAAGFREAVAVRDGLVEFSKKTGESLSIGAGQAADAFSPVFQPFTLSPAQMAEAFRDMDFKKLDPASVPKDAPKPTAEQKAEPPQPEPAASAEGEKGPGFFDPLLNVLRDNLGMEVGSVTIDEETYSRVIVQPTFSSGKFKAAFYLPIIYNGDLFNRNDYYHPLGNDEWSFGTDKNWNDDPAAGMEDVLRDLALKILYIEYGNQRDPFFMKIGNLNNMTLGHGSLMRNYANDSDFPAVRRVGVNLGIDGGFIGFEAVTGDLAEPEIFGGRMYLRPFSPWKLAFGFSAAADIDPAGDIPAGLSLLDIKEIDPIILTVAADIDLPVIEGDLINLVIFADAAGLMPYLRNDFPGSAFQTHGLVTDALYNSDGGTAKFRNYGLLAGLFGNLSLLDWRLEYRQYHGVFQPGYFGPAYDRNRGLGAISILDYLADPDDPVYDTLTLGVYGEAGFTLFTKLRFEAGYFWPWELTDGDLSVADNDYLQVKLVLDKGLIPLPPFSGMRLSIIYIRTQFVPTLLDGEDKNLELFDANTVVKGELVYPVAETIDLAFTVTTTVARDTDGTIKYDSDGNPKWAPSIGIETRIHF